MRAMPTATMTKAARWRRAVAIAGAAIVITGGCARPGPGAPDINARAVALDIAFDNEELTKPVDPQVIIEMVPAPPRVAEGVQPLSDFVTPAPTPSFRSDFEASEPTSEVGGSCKAAAPGTSAGEPATRGIDRPPKPGAYPRHNTGTIRIDARPIFDLTFPYPPATRDVLSPAREIAEPLPADPGALTGSPQEPAPSPGSGIFEWDVQTTVTPTFVVTNTYRLTESALLLVRRETRFEATTEEFVPNPAIEMLRLNAGEGTSWRSAGTDARTRTGMTLEAAIGIREPVDVCGRLVDAYRVTTTETFVDLESGAVTRNDEPNVTMYATQHGGLMVSMTQHSTLRTRDPDTGTPITVDYDFTSTLDSVEPK